MAFYAADAFLKKAMFDLVHPTSREGKSEL
jgi:hypothetical protein